MTDALPPVPSTRREILLMLIPSLFIVIIVSKFTVNNNNNNRRRRRRRLWRGGVERLVLFHVAAKGWTSADKINTIRT